MLQKSKGKGKARQGKARREESSSHIWWNRGKGGITVGSRGNT